MFKKSLAVILGTCMVCSLAGCGSAPDSGSGNSGADSKKEASAGGKKVVSFYPGPRARNRTLTRQW